MRAIVPVGRPPTLRAVGRITSASRKRNVTRPNGKDAHRLSNRNKQAQPSGPILCSADAAKEAVVVQGEEEEDIEQRVQLQLPGKSATDKVAAPTELSLGQLVRFTVPTLAIWLINPVLSLIDTGVVGTKSAVELAALGPATMIVDYTSYLFTFLAIAVTNMLAITLAKRDQCGAEKTVSDALLIAAALGAIVAAVFVAGAPTAMTLLLGDGAPHAAPAALYVRVRAFGMPLALLTHVCQAFFMAAQYPLAPLRAAVVAGTVNLAGDLLLVNGLDLGIGGAAAATVFAQVVTVTMLFRTLLSTLPGPSLVEGWRLQMRWKPPPPIVLFNFIQYSGPIFGVLLTKILTYGALTSLASSLGPVQSAAHHVVFSIYIFFAVFGDAVSQAAQTFLPAFVGRPAAAWSTARKLVASGAVFGIANSIAAAAIVCTTPFLFTSDAAVATAMRGLSLPMAVALLIQLSSMATEGMLLAGRNIVFLLISYVINMSIVIVTCRTIMQRMDGLMAVWLGIVTFQIIRLLQNGGRLLRPDSPLNSLQPLPAVNLA